MSSRNSRRTRSAPKGKGKRTKEEALRQAKRMAAMAEAAQITSDVLRKIMASYAPRMSQESAASIDKQHQEE